MIQRNQGLDVLFASCCTRKKRNMSNRIKALNESSELIIRIKPFFRRPSKLNRTNSAFLGKYNLSDLYLFNNDDLLATVVVSERTLKRISTGYSTLPVDVELSVVEFDETGLAHSVARHIATQLGALLSH